MESLDKAIEALTRLRIQAVKENRNDLEKELYEVEMLIFKSYNHNSLQQPMPLLTQFRARREKLGVSLRAIAKATNVSPSTISRIENGKEADYSNVKSLHDWYLTYGV